MSEYQRQSVGRARGFLIAGVFLAFASVVTLVRLGYEGGGELAMGLLFAVGSIFCFVRYARRPTGPR